MKRFFWVGLISVLVAVFGFSDFTRAADLTEKDCSSLGGYWKSESARPKRNDPKVCQFENKDGSYKTVKTQKDIPDTILVRNMDCPSGFTSNGSSGDALICLKKGGKSEEESKKPKVSIEDQIKAIKDDPKYKNVDWDYVRRICNGQNGAAGPDNDCVQKTADHVLTMNGGDYLNCELDENKEKEGCVEKPDQTSCEVQWVGFVVCPGARIGTSVVINLYNLIAKNLLEIKSEHLFSAPDGTVFKYWVEFRDIANVLLVIVVAIVVFSQVANVGISNYGVKQMLPRIIMFAVIVNISFWLIAAIVDISNIFGNWLYMTLGASGSWDAMSKDGGFAAMVGKILSGGAEIAGMALATGALAATIGGGSLLALLGLSALSLLLMFVILTSRQAVVIMLLVISPVAIVSSILPNTEGFYKKWKSLLKMMLMIYPICSMMMGGMILASNVLYATAGDPLFKVIYGLLPMLGLFATASIIKGVASALDKLTGTKAFSKAMGKAEGLKSGIKDNGITNWEKRARYDRNQVRWKKAENGRFGRALTKVRDKARAVSSWAENKQSQNKYDAAEFADRRRLDFLNGMSDAELQEKGLAREKYSLEQSFDKARADQNMANAAMINSKNQSYADYESKITNDIKTGDDIETIAYAIKGSQLSKGDQAKLMKKLIESVSVDLAKASTGNISRLNRAVFKSYEEFDPEVAESGKKLTIGSRNGLHGGKLTDNERESLYSRMSAKDVSKLGANAQKARTEVRVKTSNSSVRANIDRVDSVLHQDTKAYGKMNAESASEFKKRIKSTGVA